MSYLVVIIVPITVIHVGNLILSPSCHVVAWVVAICDHVGVRLSSGTVPRIVVEVDPEVEFPA